MANLISKQFSITVAWATWEATGVDLECVEIECFVEIQKFT